MTITELRHQIREYPGAIRELARLSGVSHPTILRIQSGKTRTCSLETAGKLMSVLSGDRRHQDGTDQDQRLCSGATS